MFTALVEHTIPSNTYLFSEEHETVGKGPLEMSIYSGGTLHSFGSHAAPSFFSSVVIRDKDVDRVDTSFCEEKQHVARSRASTNSLNKDIANSSSSIVRLTPY